MEPAYCSIGRKKHSLHRVEGESIPGEKRSQRDTCFRSVVEVTNSTCAQAQYPGSSAHDEARQITCGKDRGKVVSAFDRGMVVRPQNL